MKDKSKVFETGASESEETRPEAQLLDELGLFGESRRRFLRQIAGTGLSLLVIRELISQNAFAVTPENLGTENIASLPIENGVKVTFELNGAVKELTVDSRMALLDALRERLGYDRHQERLRSRTVRRLHGDRERAPRAFLSDTTPQSCEGKRDNDHRRAGQGRPTSPHAGSVHQTRRVSMRLLHARADLFGSGAAAGCSKR